MENFKTRGEIHPRSEELGFLTSRDKYFRESVDLSPLYGSHMPWVGNPEDVKSFFDECLKRFF
jgi:hypothetical protein